MEKQPIRERVWDALETSGAARFPFPPHGRIPNFAGADDAAARLAETDAWQSAGTVKANPDAPQLPVRRAALRAGKTVYMAVPRLRDAKCFYELDPERLDDLQAAPTVSHVADHARQIGPDEADAIDLVVSGSVAVTEDGARIGKGEGYSDLEFAVLRDLDLVDAATTVVTTVHELQVVDGPESPLETAAVAVPVDVHDVPMDVVVTPDRCIETASPYDRPTGIDWAALSAERIEAMPVLAGRKPD
jgi:5-formyltetrahydrofolate cyclo-ligase